MSLNLYTVHIRASSESDPDVVLVREGFSFWAFLFQFIWALVHRLWLVAAGMLALNLLAGSIHAAPIVQFAIDLGVMVLIGAEANNLWRWTLVRRGYTTCGVVMGETLEDAERRWFQTHGLHYTVDTIASDMAKTQGKYA